MITNKDIQKAFDFLRDSAVEAAQNRANRVYMEEYRKSLKAQIMAEHNTLPVNGQEREAYKDERYLAHLDAMKEAIFEDEKVRFLMEAAKIQKGSKESNRAKVGKVSWDQVKAIAEDKMPDLNCFTVESAMKMVAGTASSMGLTVEGKAPWEN